MCQVRDPIERTNATLMIMTLRLVTANNRFRNGLSPIIPFFFRDARESLELRPSKPCVFLMLREITRLCSTLYDRAIRFDVYGEREREREMLDPEQPMRNRFSNERNSTNSNYLFSSYRMQIFL